MPTPAASSEASSASPLWRLSSSLGTSSITSAPANGRNTMSVRPQSVRNALLSIDGEPWPLPSDEEDEGAGEHGDRSEEEGAVLLDLAGGEPPRRLAATPGRSGGPQHGAVDHVLVDEPVRQPPDQRGQAPGTVHDAVDHVLVEPVDRPGHGALRAAGDDVGVEGVEV